MRFKEFVNEKFLNGTRQPLYHWTDLISLMGMIKHGVIAYFDKDDYDVIRGWTDAEPTKRAISFTRDKDYAIRGKGLYGGVRISYDWSVLKHRKKTRPTVGLVGKPGGDWGDVLTGREARFEAEELVDGPIPLTSKAGLMKIELSQAVHDDVKATIKGQMDSATRLERAAKEAESRSPTLADYKAHMGLNYKEENGKSLVDKGYFERTDWKPRWWDPEVLRKQVKNCHVLAAQYQEVLDRSELITDR